MKISLFTIGLVLVLTICTNFNQGDAVLSQCYVTQLGDDLIGMEEVEKTDRLWKAKVLLRIPKITYRTYELQLNDSMELDYFLAKEYAIKRNEITDKVLSEQKLYFEKDSLVIEYNTIRSKDKTKLVSEKDIIPFVELVHWPYLVLVNQLKNKGLNNDQQSMIIGKKPFLFSAKVVNDTDAEIIHPRRGIVKLKLTEENLLEFLDATATTRKITVEKRTGININQYLNKFLEIEQERKPMVALSGRGKTEAFIDQANIIIDYGQPSKRGRALFGDLVPWGKVWRTGANLATHFTTDKDLLFSDTFLLKAGAYTLFTIPEKKGGWLIFNKNTGISGTSYQSAADIGKVAMGYSQNVSEQEKFTIRITPEEKEGGSIELVWGKSKFWAPFSVKPEDEAMLQ